MGKHIQVTDERGQLWLLQQGDPLWEALAPLMKLGYERWQVVLPNELALELRVNPPDHDNIDLLIEDGASLDEIGIRLIVEDVRKYLQSE